MFGRSWQLFRLFGIPIGIDVSWLIILALLTATLVSFFAQAVPNYDNTTYLVMGLVTALLFFCCIILHEMGHALAAKQVGIPIRGITLFLFGGVAQMEQEPRSAGAEFYMAIAGPVVSLILAALFFALSLAGAAAGWEPTIVIPLNYLAVINLVVLVFNMVPAFPLDGGRVLRSVLWAVSNDLRKATYWATLCGQAFAWLLIGGGVLQLLSGNAFGGIWFGLIGLFLNNAAQMSYQQVVIRQALQGEKLSRFMNPDPVVVAPFIDLNSWVEDYVYRYQHHAYPVVADGQVRGLVSTRDLAKLPRNDWSNHTVSDIMRTDLDKISLPPDADAMQALDKMNRNQLSRLLIVRGKELVGYVSLKDLMRFLELKLELEQGESEAPASVSTLPRSTGEDAPISTRR